MGSDKNTILTTTTVNENMEDYVNINETINSSLSTISNEHGLTVEYVILGAMIALFAIVGIVGNVPILIVYIMRKDKNASNTFIKVLACLDLLVCIGVMPYSVLYEYHLVTSDVACRLFEYLRHFAVMASNVTLVAISLERYIAVCRIEIKLTVDQINKGISAIFVFGALTAIPAVGIFAVVEPNEVETVPCIFPHQIYDHFCHFTYSIIGFNLVMAYQFGQVLIFFLLLFVIVTLYTIVYIVLMRKTQKRKQIVLQGKAVHREQRMELNTTDSFSHQVSSDAQEQSRYHKQLDSPTTPTDITQCTLVSTDNTIKPQTTNGHTNSGECNIVKWSESEPVQTKTEETDCLQTAVSNDKSTRKSIQSKVRPQKRGYSHRRTAKMLFLCTVIYFITWVPFWMDVFGLTNSLIIRYTFFIGNVTNPLIYGIVNKRVRESVQQLFKSCCWMCYKRG